VKTQPRPLPDGTIVARMKQEMLRVNEHGRHTKDQLIDAVVEWEEDGTTCRHCYQHAERAFEQLVKYGQIEGV
jgi:hypothetical protein